MDITGLFNSHIKVTGLSVSCNRLGYLLGSALVGLCYERYKVYADLQFAAAWLVCSAALAVAPFSGHVAAFLTLIVIRGAAMAYIHAGIVNTDIFNQRIYIRLGVVEDSRINETG